MGTWSADMFGSDHALDALSVLEDITGFSGSEPDDDSLYPLPSVNDTDKKTKISNCLIKHEKEILKNKWFAKEKAWHIVSCAYMAVGAPIPYLLKKRAINCCLLEAKDIPSLGWHDDGVERKAVLSKLTADLESYTGGQAIPVEHTGLLEKISASEKQKETTMKKIKEISALDAEALYLSASRLKAAKKLETKLFKKLELYKKRHRKHMEKKLKKLGNDIGMPEKYQIVGPWNKRIKL